MHATTEARREPSDPADALRRIDEVLRLSRSAIWEVDREGVFTYVSPSFEDLLGYRPEEMVGVRTIHDFYPQELSPELEMEVNEDWIGRGEPYSQLAVPLVAKSGEVIWVSSSGMPIRDAEGKVIGFRGSDRDITPLKRSEEALRTSEQNLWNQIQKAPVPMAFTTLAGATEMHVNEAFVRTFGYAQEEVATIEAWFVQAYPDPAQREQVRRDTELWLGQAARGEAPEPREYRITCRDGRVLDVEVGAAQVAGRFVGTFTDVTSRRRELEQRKAREGELRRVLDNLPFPVATSAAGPDFDWQDARAEVTYLNRRFTEVFGFEMEDIPTVSDWARLALPNEKKRREVFAVLEQQVQMALRGATGVGPAEVRVIAKDGTARDVLIQAVAVENRLVISLEDITERLRAERLLRERQEQLARVGRVSSLGQLAASLAHELEQPLGAILNNAETAKLMLARETPDVSELRAIVEDILVDNVRAGAVLDRIGGMVKGRAFEPQEVPVAQLLQEVARLVRPVAAERGIALETSCEPGAPAIHGDAVLLQQALLNLALNSVEAIGARGDGRITVRAGEGDAGTVQISVGDNGSGVPPEKFPSLFEPFFTTKSEGLGMGLPLVKSIAEQHGGELRLDNQPGRGLTVILTLPAGKA